MGSDYFVIKDDSKDHHVEIPTVHLVEANTRDNEMTNADLNVDVVQFLGFWPRFWQSNGKQKGVKSTGPSPSMHQVGKGGGIHPWVPSYPSGNTPSIAISVTSCNVMENRASELGVPSDCFQVERDRCQ